MHYRGKYVVLIESHNGKGTEVYSSPVSQRMAKRLAMQYSDQARAKWPNPLHRPFFRVFPHAALDTIPKLVRDDDDEDKGTVATTGDGSEELATPERGSA